MELNKLLNNGKTDLKVAGEDLIHLNQNLSVCICAMNFTLIQNNCKHWPTTDLLNYISIDRYIS